MKALHASFFLLALIVLSRDATLVAGARKGKKACKDAKAFGRIKNGRLCTKEGLQCNPNKPACTGIFDEDTETCTDTYIPCTCSETSGTNKTWACPMAKCMAPDERCTCDNPDLVGPGQVCYKEGLTCPNDEGIVVCFGIWDATAKACTNVTVTPDCNCYEGEWICAFADCAIPDPRCT
jgi:hypothetical protein